MNSIITNCLITGFIISLLFSIFGSLILWKKTSYFSDGLAHACLLGVVLHQLLNINIFISVYSTAFMFTLLIKLFSERHNANLITGLVAQSFLALSIILASLFKDTLNITEFFLGELLLINIYDILWLSFICLISVIWFIIYYHRLLLICISHDIAKSYNVNTTLIDGFFMIMLATIVAVTLKILGSLLVISMLIIPPASARIISKSPISMLIYSFIINLICYYAGLYLAFSYDTAVTPLIVILSFMVFVILKAVNKIKLR